MQLVQTVRVSVEIDAIGLEYLRFTLNHSSLLRLCAIHMKSIQLIQTMQVLVEIVAIVE